MENMVKIEFTASCEFCGKKEKMTTVVDSDKIVNIGEAEDMEYDRRGWIWMDDQVDDLTSLLCCPECQSKMMVNEKIEKVDESEKKSKRLVYGVAMTDGKTRYIYECPEQMRYDDRGYLVGTMKYNGE